LVLGAVVPVVNLDGIAPGRLRLTGPVLADIFLGKIRKWNDPAIIALNPGLNLPDQTIMVVHRSDGSGTTFIWSEYLSRISNEWKIKVGSSTLLSWPTGFAGKGNSGVAEKIVRLSGSIGYIDYTYAMRRHLSYAVLRNQAGNFVAPNPHSMTAATEGVDWRKNQSFNVVLNNAPQSDAYPIMAISFAILRKYPPDIGRTHALLKFFSWIYESGRNTASTEQYLPLPPLLVQQIKDYWLAEKIQSGMISHVVAAAP
jgi:phosphate transport system substrate-binding protein